MPMGLRIQRSPQIREVRNRQPSVPALTARKFYPGKYNRKHYSQPF
jgi:hypothetical protein